MRRSLRPLRFVSICPVVVLVLVCGVLVPGELSADGKMVPPRDYKGSIEESAQEAVIIFQGSETPGEAVEHMILKVTVHGKAENFAWLIPFPTEPVAAKEDAKIFKELFDYVQARRASMHKEKKEGSRTFGPQPGDRKDSVTVLSRRIVGKYDVAMVRENVPGALNKWLDAEGYQSLSDAEDVIGFYRGKKYVFACVKVSESALKEGKAVDLHPLRFTFKTGGRDGIYFPMRMTGLQQEPFDVNLYVFYRFWLNDDVSQFGYERRGFTLRYRDWDSRRCKANGGKAYSRPNSDPFLKRFAHRIPTVTRLLQKLHPGKRYYLTNLYAHRLNPREVRAWSDDLWLFPYYTNRKFVPFDAREGGCASSAYSK